MTQNSVSLLAAALAVEITPPIGVRMDGYAARQHPAQAIHDPLYASLLVLKSGQRGVALVSLDVLMISLAFTGKVRAALASALGIQPEDVMLAAIHTHSGPAGYMKSKMPLESVEDPALLEMTLRKLTGAAQWAARNLRPARLSLGRGELHDLGRNRNDPLAPMDTALTVVRVDGENGYPLAVLLNYGCHPTVLGPENTALSADYPGAARAALRQIYPETVFVFANGASGDISTRFTRRGQGFDEVQRLGFLLAGETLKVMQTASDLPVTQLSGQTLPLRLPYRRFPSVEDAQQQLASLQADLEQLRAAGRPAGDLRRAITRVEGAQAQAVMAQTYGDRSAAETEMQILRIGDLAIVGLPGEPFTRIVLDIKAASPLPHTIAVSYANDYSGYFPDRDSVLAGTYEALISPYDENVGALLAQTALEALQRGTS
jgi:hypothetical protein